MAKITKIGKKKVSKTDQNIIKLAKIISKQVEKKTLDHIRKWIDDKFEEKLNASVEHFVEMEFKKEVLPVILEHMEEKVQREVSNIDVKLDQYNILREREVKKSVSKTLQKIVNDLNKE